MLKCVEKLTAYPEIGNAHFKGTLWTFEQEENYNCFQLKNVSALWNFYSSPINVFVLYF